jgi:hypothetical protein
MQLKKQQNNTTGGRSRELVVLLSFVFVTAVFITTSVPTIYPGDSGETAASAYTLGLGHPPGYPLYMLCSKIFTMLPAGDTAFRINILASVCGGLFFLAAFFLSREILFMTFNIKPGAAAVIATLTSMFVSFSSVVWSESTQAKGGIHILADAAAVYAAYFAVRYHRTYDKKYGYMAVFLSGFLPALHQTTLVAAIIILLSVFYKNQRLSGREIRVCIILFLFSLLSPAVYIFIRMNSDPVVHWSGISGFSGAMHYIFRTVYSHYETGNRSLYTETFKLFTAFKSIFTWMNIMLIPALWGIYILFRKNAALWFYLGAFLVINTAGVIFFTSNSLSPVFAYIDRPFYILSLAVFAPAAAAGLAGLYEMISGKWKPVFMASLIMLLFGQMALNHASNDYSKSFIGYDYPLNIYKTLAAGDTLLTGADNPAFNILYYKLVDGYFKGIKIYDINANLFDLKPFAAYRGNMTVEKMRSINADIAVSSAGRVFSSEYTLFPGKPVFPSQYGVLYRLSGSDAPVPGTAGIMNFYVMRDYFNTKYPDLACRELMARYFIAAADYSALKGDPTGFENLRSLAEKIGYDNPGIMSTIAFSSFFYMHNIPEAVSYLEKSVDMDPYYTDAIRLLARLYAMEGDAASSGKWAQIYIEREKDPKNISEFRVELGISDAAKK